MELVIAQFLWHQTLVYQEITELNFARIINGNFKPFESISSARAINKKLTIYFK